MEVSLEIYFIFRTNILPEVFQDMKLSQEQRENLNVFLLNNTEPFSWGELKNKAMLGLPFWFKFNSLAEVNIIVTRMTPSISSEAV